MKVGTYAHLLLIDVTSSPKTPDTGPGAFPRPVKQRPFFC